jgi:hypothetical protein
MKKLILLVAVTLLVGVSQANAQTKDKVAVKPGSLATANPLMKYFGKTMDFSRHVKAGNPVNHVAGDYVLIKGDNTAQAKVGADVLDMTWTYDKATNKVTLTVPSNGQQTVWNVQKSEASNLVLFNEQDKETISLIPRP